MDAEHYRAMVAAGDAYVGVRHERLDHWLCANRRLGLEVRARKRGLAHAPESRALALSLPAR